MLSSAIVVAELVVEAGMDAGQRYGLSQRTRLGRAPDNEIVLRDPQASRYHAMIALSGSGYVLSDLGSANGTLVNGVRMGQPSALRHGDLIVIGGEQLRFQQR
jgi:pSer/pThr/pTyr-binding forkhead associated (FHA) protein